MNTFHKDLALSMIKAIIITFIVMVGIISLSSCERVADRNTRYSNDWRATVLKTNRTITVKNMDSLCVMSGDTVTVFYMEGCGGQPSYYYISNSPTIACDTSSVEIFVDGKDTVYTHFEAWNVRLERRIAR